MDFKFNKAGKIALTKMASLALLLFLLGLVLSVFYGGDDAKLTEATSQTEDVMDSLIDLSKPETDVELQSTQSNPVVFNFWRNFAKEIDEIQASSIFNDVNYCIYPWNNIGFSEDAGIVFLESDQGSLLEHRYKPNDAYGKSYQFDISNLNFDFKAAQVSSSTGPFSNLILENIESIAFMDGKKLRMGVNELEAVLLPITAKYDNYEGRGTGEYNKVIRNNDLNAYDNFLVLVGKDSIAFPYVDFKSTYEGNLNLLAEFKDGSLIGKEGLQFCKNSDRDILLPKSYTNSCKCSYAKTLGACKSLGSGICGQDCFWHTDEEDGGATEINSCKSQLTSVSAFRNNLKLVFERALNSLEDKPDFSCYMSIPFELNEPVDGLSEDDMDARVLTSYFNGMELKIEDNSLKISNENEHGNGPVQSIELNEELDFVFYIKGYDEDVRNVKGSNFDVIHFYSVVDGCIREGHDCFGYDSEGKYRFIFEKSVNSLKLFGENTFLDVSKESVNFCDLESAYAITRTPEMVPCSEIKYRDLCLFHKENGKNCYWQDTSFWGLGNSKCAVSGNEDAEDFLGVASDQIEQKAYLLNSVIQNTQTNNCYQKIEGTSFEDDGRFFKYYLRNMGDDSALMLRAATKLGGRFVEQLVIPSFGKKVALTACGTSSYNPSYYETKSIMSQIDLSEQSGYTLLNIVSDGSDDILIVPSWNSFSPEACSLNPTIPLPVCDS